MVLPAAVAEVKYKSTPSPADATLPARTAVSPPTGAITSSHSSQLKESSSLISWPQRLGASGVGRYW